MNNKNEGEIITAKLSTKGKASDSYVTGKKKKERKETAKYEISDL